MHSPKTTGSLDRRDAPAPALLALLVAIASIGPMSLNIVMPALPGIAVALKADPVTVQLTLSLYLVCMALSQLVLGVLSDRFGRRPVLIGGLLLTVAASVVATFATTIGALVTARAVQAFGASCGIVISRAIVRDLFARDRAASMLGWVTMVIMVVPMIVPPLGGLLDTTLGWPSIFASIALFAAAVLAWVWIALPETNAEPLASGGLVRFFQEVRLLLASRVFLGYVLSGATSSALFFVFLGGAPHVISRLQGRSAFELGVWLATASVAYMAGNFISARYSMRFGVDAMVAAGSAVGVAGGICVIVLVLWFADLGPLIICLPQWITAFANGLLIPNAIAGGISVRPQAAGTAAGIHGFVQMGVAAASAQWVSHLLAQAPDAAPMAWMLLAFSLACAVSFVCLILPGSAARRAD
ncbi:MAG TPA: multidrug effflux MFS transporter [Xanthobacteraceae bacterium]|nr:multidrug effflux MFS transporter [Xanthobacteraceae bacterium]